MAVKKPLPRLLCYDIADPRRLARVHRIVIGHAIPVQYSVYYLYADADALERLCAELREVIHPDEDDIRIYPLHESGGVETLGAQGMPDGIHLAGSAIPEGLNGQPQPENGE